MKDVLGSVRPHPRPFSSRRRVLLFSIEGNLWAGLKELNFQNDLDDYAATISCPNAINKV